MPRNYTVLPRKPMSLSMLVDSLQLKPNLTEQTFGRAKSKSGYSYVVVYQDNTYVTFSKLVSAQEHSRFRNSVNPSVAVHTTRGA